MNLHIFIHADFEVSSVLFNWAEERGLNPILVPRHLGAPLPPLEEVNLLSVLGGPMSAYDPIPWIQEEITYLSAALAQKKKILGICLGSQILAAALGSRVYPGESKEIGWHDLRTSTEALTAFPYLPETWKVFHWHGDTYLPPEGVLPLGMSDLTPCQGFFMPPHLVALQFHPEVTTEEIKGFERAEDHYLPESGDSAHQCLGNQRLFRKILDQWYQGLPETPVCSSCSELAFPLFLENPLDGDSPTREFPDQFLNLRIPDADLLLFYRNTERRLLECPGCGKAFLYSQRPSGKKDWVKEVLWPLNPQGRQLELTLVEDEAIRQARDYKTTYEVNLPRIQASLRQLRGY